MNTLYTLHEKNFQISFNVKKNVKSNERLIAMLTLRVPRNAIWEKSEIFVHQKKLSNAFALRDY